MTRSSRIVLLNGAGSAGKSSIARALQEIAAVPFLHVEMDSFIKMLPDGFWGDREGFELETIEEDGRPAVAIKTGPAGERLMRGMRRAIAAMAAAGNELIVDDVLMDGAAKEYEALLAGFTVYRVGVFAPLDVLEARERARGDRMVGLARGQFRRVHAGLRYDLTLDTASASAAECAERIRREFGL